MIRARDYDHEAVTGALPVEPVALRLKVSGDGQAREGCVDLLDGSNNDLAGESCPAAGGGSYVSAVLAVEGGKDG